MLGSGLRTGVELMERLINRGVAPFVSNQNQGEITHPRAGRAG
jgi:hypothetical protein